MDIRIGHGENVDESRRMNISCGSFRAAVIDKSIGEEEIH